MARPFCDAGIVMKYAVAFQARRNMLGLREGEEDTMELLPYEKVAKSLEELENLFQSRPDQRQRRAGDERNRARLQTKRSSGMQSPQKRANGRFKAMIHQIFGLTVEPDADVGAQSPDIEYFVKKR